MASFYRLFSLLLVLIGHNVHAQFSPAAAEGAAFVFRETVHDFGQVPTDTTVEHTFEFTNRGNALLIINDISLSCPCFSANWIKGPVMPGEKGWVSVSYPTTGKPGPFDKILWIVSNAVNNSPNLDRFELRIKGLVQKAGTAGSSLTNEHGATSRPADSLQRSGTVRPKRSSRRHR